MTPKADEVEAFPVLCPGCNGRGYDQFPTETCQNCAGTGLFGPEPPLIGCIQHDCAHCKTNAEALKAAGFESVQQLLESHRALNKELISVDLSRRNTLLEIARLREQVQTDAREYVTDNARLAKDNIGLREQVAIARRDALEEAAKVCDSLAVDYHKAWKARYDPNDQGKSDGADECGSAIRSLIPNANTSQKGEG